MTVGRFRQSTRPICRSSWSCPRRSTGRLRASIVIESNGGTHRIAVRIERPTEQVVVPESSSAASSSAFPLWRDRLGGSVARMPWGLESPSPAAERSCCDSSPSWSTPYPWAPHRRTSVEPRLSAERSSWWFWALAGLTLASRRGEGRDYLAAGFAGGSLGLLASAVWFAADSRASSGSSARGRRRSGAVVVLWGTLGALFAIILDRS